MNSPWFFLILLLALYGLFKLFFYIILGEVVTLKDLYESAVSDPPDELKNAASYRNRR